jgi:uncharacterized protein YaaQ
MRLKYEQDECTIQQCEGKQMMTNQDIDLLVLAIVASQSVNDLTQELVKHAFYFTRVDSSGGLLGEARVSLLIGINQSRTQALLDIIQERCQTRLTYIPAHVEATLRQGQPFMIEAEVGGAKIYIFKVEHFEQI